MAARFKASSLFGVFICLLILSAGNAHSASFATFAMGADPQVRNVSGSRPSPLQIRRKIKRLQRYVKEIRQSGKDPMPVMRLMMQVPPLMKQRRVQEADEILDEALRVAEDIKSGKEAEAGEEAQAKSPAAGSYEKVRIKGNAATMGGIADPSIEYGPDGTGWLVYTAVDVKNGTMATRLAKTVDHGKTWKFVKVINPPVPDTVDGVEGNWIHETSTLVYDPGDRGKEWKLFWFRYFRAKGRMSKNKKHTFLNSWIAYRYASNPAGEWSEEIPVFGMGNYRNKGIDLSGLSPDLKDFVFYYELGSLYKDGTIYLSMEGSATATGFGEWDKRKIILLSSRDHAGTWKYLGVLTDSKDAHDAGYMIFTGSSLVEEKGRDFLLVSPSGRLSNPRDPSGHHDGTNVYEFEDISKARLKRDANGKLILIKHIPHNLTKGGQADYDEHNTAGGIVIPQEDLKYYPDLFQLFSTHERIVN